MLGIFQQSADHLDLGPGQQRIAVGAASNRKTQSRRSPFGLSA